MPATWVAGTERAATFDATLAAVTPAGIANGDTLLAAVSSDTAVTGPAGWTKIFETATFTDGTTTRKLSVFAKDAVTSGNSSTSYSWTRGAGYDDLDYLFVCYAVLRGVSALAESASTVLNNVDQWTVSPPALTASDAGQMFVLFASHTHQYAGTQNVTPPSGSTKFTGGSLFQPRLAGAYQARGSGQSNSGFFDFKPSAGSVTNGLAAVTLRFSGEPPPAGAAVSLPRLTMAGGQYAKGNAAITLPPLTAPAKPAAPSFWTRRERTRELA